MSLIKHWITNLTVIGLSLMAVCPIASAQSVFDDSETDATPPKAEWRQKVLHNNRASQQITREESDQDSTPHTIKWSPYPNSGQAIARMPNDAVCKFKSRRNVEQRSPNANPKQDAEYQPDQRPPYQNSNRMRPSGVSPSGNAQPKSYRVAQREMPAMVEGDPGATQYEPLAAARLICTSRRLRNELRRLRRLRPVRRLRLPVAGALRRMGTAEPGDFRGRKRV